MIIHKPVLLKETIENLNLKKGMAAVDATLGGGGYSREILKAVGEKGRLIGIDLDQRTIDNFNKESKVDNFSKSDERIILVRNNFAHLEDILKNYGINSVNAIVADLGLSSDQLEDKNRGFSFLGEGKLDMRFDQNQKLTVEEIVNNYGQKDLEKILREYGEERYARNIARKIVEERKKKAVKTTLELVEIINKAIPERHKRGKINIATRTFQALRIEVNNELENLKRFIPQAIRALSPKGRLAIISFHSLEDRIVKNIFRENARGCICPKEFPICQCGEKPRVKIITRKPIAPSLGEIENNPRARSAKLRVCEKI